jgi:hypothetical protein
MREGAPRVFLEFVQVFPSQVTIALAVCDRDPYSDAGDLRMGPASDDPDLIVYILSRCSRCHKAKLAHEQRKREADGRFNPFRPYFKEGHLYEMSNLKDGNRVEERRGVQA